MFDEPPTLKQLAKMCNTSHQNTKQLVLKLESKGFLEVTKDPKDARAMRICATAKCTEWELANQENNAKFVNQMFFTLTQEEILVTMTSLLKIYDALEDMANEQK